MKWLVTELDYYDYFPCFHATSALLINNCIEAHTHAGVRQAFGLNFVKNGPVSNEDARIFSRIYNKRQTSDYDDFKDITMSEANQLYPEVTRFVNLVIDLIK